MRRSFCFLYAGVRLAVFFSNHSRATVSKVRGIFSLSLSQSSPLSPCRPSSFLPVYALRQEFPRPVPCLPRHFQRNIRIDTKGQTLFFPGKPIGKPPVLPVLKIQPAAVRFLAYLRPFGIRPCRTLTLASVNGMASFCWDLRCSCCPRRKMSQLLNQHILDMSLDYRRGR